MRQADVPSESRRTSRQRVGGVAVERIRARRIVKTKEALRRPKRVRRIGLLSAVRRGHHNIYGGEGSGWEFLRRRPFSSGGRGSRTVFFDSSAGRRMRNRGGGELDGVGHEPRCGAVGLSVSTRQNSRTVAGCVEAGAGGARGCSGTGGGARRGLDGGRVLRGTRRGIAIRLGREV